VAAYEVAIEGDDRAKVREPGLVLLWSVLTLGIYTAVWYYRLNRELRDFGREKGDEKLSKGDPGLSLLAVTLGVFVIVPPFVSYWRCVGRIRHAQSLVGDPLLNGWVIGLCYVGGIFFILPLLAIPLLVQDALNKIWKRYPRLAGPDAAEPAQPATPAESAPQPAAEESSRSS
jgi:hypothetical protein